MTPAKLEQYQISTLVNDDSLCVSEIYLAESCGVGGTLRAGVICQPTTSDDYKAALDLSAIVESSTSIPKAVGYGHRYFGRVNVPLFSKFDICLDERDVPFCLGIRFYGNGGPTIIGQWRLDKAIVSGHLPTTISLSNFIYHRRSLVAITCISQAADSVSLAGILDWWTGPRGSEIVSCLA